MRLVRQKYVGWLGVEYDDVCMNGSTIFPVHRAGGQLEPAVADGREIRFLHRSIQLHHDPSESAKVLKFLESLYKI